MASQAVTVKQLCTLGALLTAGRGCHPSKRGAALSQTNYEGRYTVFPSRLHEGTNMSLVRLYLMEHSLLSYHSRHGSARILYRFRGYGILSKSRPPCGCIQSSPEKTKESQSAFVVYGIHRLVSFERSGMCRPTCNQNPH